MSSWLNVSALLTDLYELTMSQVYVERDMLAPATFSLFVRKLPQNRSFLLAAGLWPLLEALQDFRFSEEDLAYLESLKLFKPTFLDYLKNFRFTGEVWALPEGTVFFENAPVVEITAPLPEAQIVETLVINILNIETAVATKAALCVIAADGRPCVDFGARRTQGLEASLHAARASYIAGFTATSNVLAGKLFGIPVTGTMAHSYVESFPNEEEAFLAFGRNFPENTVLLIDTYDPLRGAEKAIEVARRLSERGIRVRGVRLDSGNVIELAREVRRLLDKAGFPEIKIFVSGGLDEHKIAEIVSSRAPVDAFGIGTKMGVSADAPYLDLAYKLVEYDGKPRLKLSEGKVTYPGRKQVFRRFDPSGLFYEDELGLREENLIGNPLLKCFMRDGRLLMENPPLPEIRKKAAENLKSLPEDIRKGQRTPSTRISEKLRALYSETVERIRKVL
ncbi:nicotinate phosphoribosyltransferase [Thermosulfurimonas dismutans]|uniref:Nicotinate phosphoribosyltransferase n=1 Tax=Thermosulfurimonas dismutans TaxID=999894 RepID=A0A179D6Z3_9BACT|nr:nicotinate phosphoribosyltransferase [Thermosulfurimonas dismutans]OAQ21860.1 Nicotinate phosphoribosyltransferase [Thermosulfurimonas dismutans]